MKKLIKIIRGWIFTKAEKDFLNSPIGKNIEKCEQIIKEINEEITERKIITKKICSNTILVKEFLMKLCEELYVEEFKPRVVYVANTYINEEELLSPIEWISTNKLCPALLEAKETDEKWEGKFIYNYDEGDRCIEWAPQDGFCVKLTIDKSRDNFLFKFVNTLNDRQWKMRMMFIDIENTIKKMDETKKIFKEWMTLRN